MKRFLSLLFCLCMVLPLLALLPIEVGATTATAKISVEKTTFVYGEPIMVTPLVGGTNTWIGISPQGKVTSGSVRWMKVETNEGSGATKGAGVGVPVDIRQGGVAGNRYSLADIGVGSWTIFWCQGDRAAQYDQASIINITVVAGPMTVNKTEFAYGEPILVTAVAKENPTYKSWYGIVPDSGGKPKYSYGTIINRKADGTEDDLRDYSDSLSGTVSNNTKNWANYFGISQRQLLLLPAGTYWLVYCEDSNTVSGGTAVTHKIQIRIKPAFTTNKKTYSYGEAITVSIGAGLEAGDSIFIAPRHENIEQSYYSIRWQTLTAANISAGSFNIKASNTTSNYPDLWDVPPGDYSLFAVYAPNDRAYQNDHGTRIDITVSGDIPDAPTGITYLLDDKTTGMAAGKVTVSIDPNEVDDVYNKPSHVILYWGDENGNKLADYTYIRMYKVTGATTEIDMPDVTAIPEEAACLMACAYNGAGVSEGLVKVDLPADRTKAPDKGKLLSSFQIVSDIHTQETQTHKYNQRIAQMLADIKVVDPDSVGIFVAGDAVNDGWVEEYENLIALWEESGVTAPLFLATGNHEWKIGDAGNSYTTDYEREKNRFIQYNNQLLEKGGYGDHQITNGKPYYDLWVNGFHYIFLASEAPITHAYLSDAQLSWLREKLAEDRDENRPTFIMLHQQMYNVIDGAMPIQDWDGVIAGDANYQTWKAKGVWKTKGLYEGPFRDILADFPEAMVFSGHSHWDMTDANNIYDPNNPTDVTNNPLDANGNRLYPNTLPNYLFNTAAVAYLVSGVEDEVGLSYPNWTSSKGYYVRVYENCIELWGRDFSTAQWVPNAMYRMELDLAEECTHEDNASCATVCKHCGEALTPTANHTTDYDCDATCKTCGEAVEHAEHSGKKACSTVCQYGCGTTVAHTAEHSVTTPCTDTACSVCGETVTPVAHSGKKDCSTVCQYGCGTTVAHTAEHSVTIPCTDTACSVCGETVTPVAHESDTPCTTAPCHYGCGATVTATTTHIGELECSTVCRYGCGTPVDGEVHRGKFDCSSTCQYGCGTRVSYLMHEGEFECSTLCRYGCGIRISGKAHAGKKPCSTVCQYNCGTAVDATAEHTASKPCTDTACTECGETLTPAAHTGIHACSTTCRWCDATLTTVGAHTFGNWENHSEVQHKHTCVCGTVAYADHTWNNGTVTKQPTTSATGSKTFACTDCGTTKQETLDKLPTTDGSVTDNNAGAGNTNADGTADKDGSSAVVVVVIVVAAVAVLGGGGVTAYLILRKKRKA